MRPHRWAAERVGFLFARPDEFGSAASLLLGADYCSVPDKCYIDDCSVGARIDSHAIRAALQHSLDTESAVIHVHVHPGSGRPWFSPDDIEGWSRLMPSFCAVVPQVPHAAVVLTRDHAAGLVWRSREDEPHPFTRISIVGFPIKIYEHQPEPFSL